MSVPIDARNRTLEPLERVVVIVGNYGSGKTEVSVNWMMRLAEAGRRDLAIADLDVVNPYFRCREAAEEMEARGIRVVVPRGEQFHSELPIILPEVRGLLARPDGTVLFDVGGDDVGARVLRSFAGAFGAHEMLQVVNAFRPFTDTVDGCLRILDEIEVSSGMAATGLLSNAHLMDETDAGVILRGAELAAAVGARRGLPVRFVTAIGALADEVAPRLERRMLPPWKRPVRPKMGREIFKRV
jgi:hypothetical protein